MKTLFCIEAISILILIIYFINNIAIALFVSLFIFLLMKVVEIFVFCSTYRLFTYTINENEFFESFIFKKSLCTVDKTKPIYYTIFLANEGMFSRKKYIALSNEPFEFQDTSSIRLFPWDKKPFLVSYNVKKQIVMPYNETTQLFLETEIWKSISQAT